MKFTIVEGLSVEGIAQSLVDQKVFASADRFLELCRTGEGIKDKYDFIADVANKGDEGRIYLLEGYLRSSRWPPSSKKRASTIPLTRFPPCSTTVWIRRWRWDRTSRCSMRWASSGWC